jgi:hypothetical protein
VNPTLETVVEIAAALGLELRLVPVAAKKPALKPRRSKSDARAA